MTNQLGTETTAAGEEVTRLPSAKHLRANPGWATVVQCGAFVRKELVEILRQPKLLALLVIGPFLLLVLFGVGFQDSSVVLKTKFVGPAGSGYEQGVQKYADQLKDYIVSEGFTADEAGTINDLRRGRIDAVVVFPPDALDQVLDGKSATIKILHNKLDPFQQTAVYIASRLAVQEINASIITTAAAEAQQTLKSNKQIQDELTSRLGELTQTTSDPEQTKTSARALNQTLDAAHTYLSGNKKVFAELGGADRGQPYDEVLNEIDKLRQNTSQAESSGQLTDQQRTDVNSSVEKINQALPKLESVDPAILARPFAAETASIAPVPITPRDYFAPSSIILLLQHLALTFAALSLVRDRQLGLFQLLRVGPLSSTEIILGKTLAYLLIGFAVGAGLIAAAVYLLQVPFQGFVLWAAAIIALVLLASLALGMVISLISRTEIQAVQYAMLTLLAGMFFSGFLLDLSLLSYPVKALAFAMPVTFGIAMLKDVMLTGVMPERNDLLGLSALVVVYGLLAILLLRRELKRA